MPRDGTLFCNETPGRILFYGQLSVFYAVLPSEDGITVWQDKGGPTAGTFIRLKNVSSGTVPDDTLKDMFDN